MYCRRLALLVPVVFISACGTKTAPGPAPRYAVVRFENLTGRSDFEWTARAASEFLSRTISGAMDGLVLTSDSVGMFAGALGVRPAAAPGISTQRSTAVLAGANRLIHGYVETVAGGVRVTAVEENSLTGMTLATHTAVNKSPFEALNELGRQFSVAAHPYETRSEAAFQAYCKGLEPSGANAGPDAVAAFRQAVALDPDFGPAWVALVRAIAVTEPPGQALAVAEQAGTHKLDALDAANIRLQIAALRKDEPGRIAALRALAEINAGDATLWRTLAEGESAKGQFAEAAADWKRMTENLPGDANAWNQLGYSRAWSGDAEGALAALREYARLQPDNFNPLDSRGDVQYSFGRYSEAAASYLAADAKARGLRAGGELYKAAWARFRAGDKAGADAIFARFREIRSKSTDGAEAGNVVLSEADWLYRTDRKAEGMKLLRNAVAQAPPALQTAMLSQLVIWDLIEGNRSAAAADAAAASHGPMSAPVALVRFVALPSATAAEWRDRAGKAFPAPQMAVLKNTALAYALMLDGKAKDALPVWKELMAITPATDFQASAMLARLEGRAASRAVIPDAGTLNPFAALLDKL